MDLDGLPIVGAAVDFTKVSPIHQKRTLAFVNHFVTHTVHFLNKFSSVCETKLEEINVKIQRIETSLSILEAKLSSIPGLDDVTLQSTDIGTSPMTTADSSNGSATPTPTKNDQSSQQNEHKLINIQISDTPESQRPTTLTVSQDQRYAKYLKLIQMGVPQMALRPKMLADGLDPDLLDTPNAPAPPEAISVKRNVTESESDPTSEFSD